MKKKTKNKGNKRKLKSDFGILKDMRSFTKEDKLDTRL